MAAGKFDLNDMRMQLRQMQKMGGLGNACGHDSRPQEGAGADGGFRRHEKTLVHLDALIGSMTQKERDRPELLNAKRKIRVAKGAGLQAGRQSAAQMHKDMETTMKKLKKMGGLKGLAKMFGGGGLGGMLGGGGAVGGHARSGRARRSRRLWRRWRRPPRIARRWRWPPARFSEFRKKVTFNVLNLQER